MSEELNPRQAAFVREYLVDFNGKQAAIRAGYAAGSAEVQASRLLTVAKVQQAIKAGQQKLAEATETEAEWVRRRLKEEATDYSEFASHSARIKALELLGKINGIFEKDNKQKTDPVRDLISALTGNVVGTGTVLDDDSDDDQDDES